MASINDLNGCSGGSQGDVQYDWTGNIKSIGGEPVKYDIFGNNITSIGGEPVKYDIFGNNITSIGGEPVKYDMFSKYITHVGDKPVQYDLFWERIKRIGTNDLSGVSPYTPNTSDIIPIAARKYLGILLILVGVIWALWIW